MNYDDLTVRYDVIVEYRGLKVLDRKTASVLKTIREKKSILGTAKALGLPYSQVYDTITRIERLTGKKIVEVRLGGRGGGGTVLTDFGERLISLYELALAKLVERGLGLEFDHLSEDPVILIAHSYDPALPTILSKLTEDGVEVQSICAGSKKALAMLILELVDVACINLYDPESHIYNRKHLEKLWLLNDIELLGGYSRELVFVLRQDLKINSLDEIFQKILNGELIVAGVDKSSGIRILLEFLLTNYARKVNLDLKRVRGLESELPTPNDVARCVMQNKADVGLTLRYIAEKYGLKYISVTWDVYECYALKTRLNNVVHKLKDLLNSNTLKQTLSNLPGYKTLS